MILADTSVWIDHFRAPNADFVLQLEETRILMHPYVLGELMLGGIPDERMTRLVLEGLPEAIAATSDEVFSLIDSERLSGSGIGYVDAALLASVRLRKGTRLWTRDRRLAAVAAALSLRFEPGGSLTG